MIKRFLTLSLAAMLLLSLLPAAVAEDDTPDPHAGYYYVYTANGKGLNVREEPNSSGRVVGSLKYGARIHVDAFTSPEWALILYKYNKPGYGTAQYAAWVSTRYLTKKKPAPFKAQDNTAATTTAKSSSSATGAGFPGLQEQFASAIQVAPFTVSCNPARSSGWTYLRWGPSAETPKMATFSQGYQLTVIAETRNWYQVEDPKTGKVGFVSKLYVK